MYNEFREVVGPIENYGGQGKQEVTRAADPQEEIHVGQEGS